MNRNTVERSGRSESLQHFFVLFTGENVREFFFRVASLTFEASVLAELEKSSSRSIGDVVSKYRINFRTKLLCSYIRLHDIIKSNTF